MIEDNDIEKDKPGFMPIEKYLVLYIEDNPANIKLISTVLGRIYNLDVLTAITAEYGIELAIARRPHLILMDINLPGMSGVEALRHLKLNSVTCDIPVIAITADTLPESIENGLRAGFEEYITKPINIYHLKSIVVDILVRQSVMSSNS